MIGAGEQGGTPPMPRTVRLALRMLPPGELRERYAEQWAADLRDADDAGIPRRSIAVGALRFALLARAGSIGADPLELDRQSWRRARWAAAFIGTAALGSTVGFIGIGGLAGVDDVATEAPALLPVVVAPALISLVSAVVGVALLVLAATRRPRIRFGSVLVVLALSVGVLLVAVWPVQSAIVPSTEPLLYGLGLLALVVGSVTAFIAWEVTPRPRETLALARAPRMTRPSSSTIVAGGVVALLAAVGFGAVEGLVWGPLDQTDNALTIEELYAALLPSEVISAIIVVAVWAVGGVILAVILLAVQLWMRRRGTPEPARLAVVAPMALLALGFVVLGQGFATFGIGMAIADTLPPYTGSRSLAWTVYAALGATVGLIGAFLALAPRHRRAPDGLSLAALGRLA
ncbi:hypothetical protein [Microcella frigidaquae]|uniref:Uncharacterized protein n=1 Tax=Microcella frigidaquae TaxID=424758 RepID=A0A840XLC8_9MICO|nr:hypothetical protein [Microcella frigidaquae]MBB5617438.1 hypothetical protein [Microcella frigidaquae]NHN45903.1 hypothetical protein [Microcella frigidaquae]